MRVYLLAGSRTPFGSFMGTLSTVPAPKLAATAIQGTLNKSQIAPSEIQEVFMGQVVQAGVGQAPARQALMFAGLPDSIPSTTINKVCGSGLQSVLLGAQTILSGQNKLVLAGGMENMSLAPHLLPQSRVGAKFGPVEMKDSMQWDGLWDVYSQRAMGNCAEECVRKYNFSKEQQDQFAIESFKRAQAAQKNGIFDSEITPVQISTKNGTTEIKEDEGPMKVNFEKLPLLKPAFEKDGTITAANASTINDGAATLLVGGEDYKNKAKFRILSFASHAQHPTWFSTAPVGAMEKSLIKANIKITDIDLFEINEAFAAVTMAAMVDLKIPHEKVNIHGGAVALGHPIGASGTRILLSLMNAMDRNQKRLGCASICIGGGEALSIIIEKVN